MNLQLQFFTQTTPWYFIRLGPVGCLIYDACVYGAGQLVYHGPREEVVPFFASCGFQCPPRKAVPDFLQELTSRKDQQAWFFSICHCLCA